MEREAIVERLRETEVARGLSIDEARLLADAGQVRSYGPGEVLLEEGESRGTLLVVLGGQVEVVKNDEAGGEQCLVTLGNASVLGEMGLLRGVPASATVRTTAPTEVFALDYEAFHRLLDREELAAYKAALGIARILGERLERMNEQAVQLCDKYEEALATAGEVTSPGTVHELTEFRSTLSQWNF